MFSLWRICRSKHISTAFSGLGAEKTGGRWNSKGVAITYASENLSLAVLELFVHVSPEDIPEDLVSIHATLPDSASVRRIDEVDLPRNWRQFPAPAELQTIGTEWLLRRESLMLIVPSAINPLESNILVNPRHPEITQLKVNRARPFAFDPRMFGK